MPSETFYGVEVPLPLRELSQRHQQHLSELVTQLREVGMDEPAIENAVERLIVSYRDQLLGAVKSVAANHA